MKAKITTFIDGLIMYDYILFGSSFLLFILLIILGILLRKKTLLAIFFILLSFAILLLSPTFGYLEMHKYLFKNSVELTSQKRLEFTNAIVVKGVVSNISKFNFQSCKVVAKAHKVSKNKYKNYLLQFKIIKKKTIVIEDIKKGESKEFKLFIEPFTYSKDYNISLGASCK